MRRILMVDDAVHTRLALRAWLKRYGFRVATAEAKPHRRHAATFAAVASVQSKPSGKSLPFEVLNEGAVTG